MSTVPILIRRLQRLIRRNRPTGPVSRLSLSRVNANTVTANWTASEQGSSIIVSALLEWGDTTTDTYAWPGTKTANHTFPTTPIGSRTVRITLTDANGLKTSTSGEFVVNTSGTTPPVAVLTLTTVDPNTVTASTAGSTPGTGNTLTSGRFAWGDGTSTTYTGTTASRTHDYPATPTGPRTITATVTDSSGASGNATATFEVTEESTMPLQDVYWSDTVPDSYGVNVHLRDSGTVYSNRTEVVNKVDELGIRWIRDRFAPNVSGQETQWKRLPALGIKVHTTIAPFGDAETLSDFRSLRNQMTTKYGSDLTNIVGSIAGPNEPNKVITTTWATTTINMTKNGYTAFKETSATSSIPYVSAGFYDAKTDTELANDYKAIGDLSAYVDYGDYHRYPAGETPTNGLSSRKLLARAAWGAQKPFYCTEGGYQDSQIMGSGYWVSQRADAIYGPRHLMEHIYDGTRRFFKYELLNDPENTREGRLGMVMTPSLDPSTWYNKPIAVTMKRFFTLMADNPSAGVFTPARYRMTITGSATDFKWRLYQKRNGRHLLVMWRNIRIWDRANYTDLYPSAQNVTVTIPTARAGSLWNPYSSASPVTTYTLRTSFTVPLAGELVVLELE